MPHPEEPRAIDSPKPPRMRPDPLAHRLQRRPAVALLRNVPADDIRCAMVDGREEPAPALRIHPEARGVRASELVRVLGPDPAAVGTVPAGMPAPHRRQQPVRPHQAEHRFLPIRMAAVAACGLGLFQVFERPVRRAEVDLASALRRERLKRGPVQGLEEAAPAPLGFWDGRSSSAACRGLTASRTSQSEKNRWLRAGARTHRPTFGPPLPTFAGPGATGAAGGQDRGPVVGRQILVCPVDVGFVSARAPHGRLFTAAFSLSGTTSSGVPRQNSNIRACDAVQSGSDRVNVTSTKV